jgi:putative heme-binding domain-containing protein
VDKDFALLARNDLAETVMASPAVSRGQLFICGAKHLFGVGQQRLLAYEEETIVSAKAPSLAALLVALVARAVLGGSTRAGAEEGLGRRFQVPPGFVVEKVAGPPLLRYPLFASFDDRGRLYVAEGTGTNLPGEELARRKLGRILRLEDADGDGRFDTSTVFADGLVFPQGVLWHDGPVYTASHPSFWRLEDTAGAGKADRRDELLSGFRFNGNGCDIHGPFLGPDGRLYWTDGRHGYKVKTRDGQALEGLASRIWRCRADGTDVERLCGGGFDNPVQLAFSPEGDLFGTMDQGPGDALLHYVEGAVFPMEHPCLKEFVTTGPLLGSMKSYPTALPAGLCGFMRYRSDHLGKEYQNSYFGTHYVQHKLVQVVLSRDGATFRAEDRDFLTTSDHDVRLTDVVEDADGSLLVVDMGGWFTYGFPGNPPPRPKALGALYRIRRAGTARVADPWGRLLHLAERTPGQLTPLLDDPRPKVRDQVVARLTRHAAAAVPALQAVVRNPGRTAEARRNAVWSLCQLESAQARGVLRQALADASPGVRQAAVHALGLQRDERAAAGLRALLAREEPPLRLKIAEALGRIGRPEAVPDLLAALARDGDRFLEHALVYALIRINDRAGTLPALADPNPRVRRAGLMALDQMAGGALTREQVVPLLDTDDAELQQSALAVMSRHEGWARDTLGLLRAWLRSDRRTADQDRSLQGALLAFSADQSVQGLVAEHFADAMTNRSTKMLLLSILGRCPLDPLPAAWLEVLGRAVKGDDLALTREAVAVVKARNLSRFDAPLAVLSRDEALPAELRIAALECLAPRRQATDAASFALLTSHLSDQTEPLLRVAAARALGAAALDGGQLKQLAGHLTGAGVLTLRLLLQAFTGSRDGEVGRALAEALARAPGAEALSLRELDEALRGYPAEVRNLTRDLHEKLERRQNDQAATLGELSARLDRLKGDARVGRDVFFSRKVGCYGCHRAAGAGGQVGPDLSRIGRFRSRAELLESVAFPSLVIAPEFRSYRVATKSGKVVVGLVVREGGGAIHLRTPDLAEVRVARKDVEEVQPSDVSLMPDGLDKLLSRQELADLLEFLAQQR